MSQYFFIYFMVKDQPLSCSFNYVDSYVVIEIVYAAWAADVVKSE